MTNVVVKDGIVWKQVGDRLESATPGECADEIERLRWLIAEGREHFGSLWRQATAADINAVRNLNRPSHEPCERRPPMKLEDYGPVVDEVAPVSKEAWDALKSQGASRDVSSTREKVEQRAMELRETGVKLIPNSWRCQHGTVYAWPIAVAVCGCDRDSQRTGAVE